MKSSNHNAELRVRATSALHAVLNLRLDGRDAEVADVIERAFPREFASAARELEEAEREGDERRAREAAVKAQRQAEYYAENPHLHPDAVAARRAAREAHAAWWSEGTRADDALKAALDDVERRPVPSGGLCLWVVDDGIAAAGLTPRDALRRAAREHLSGWAELAREGEFEPESDAIYYLETSVYEGGPVFIDGDPDVLDMLLRNHFDCNGTSMPEVADELRAATAEANRFDEVVSDAATWLRDLDASAEPNDAATTSPVHWTPEARRAAVDRFWAVTWPELVDQVDARLHGPVLWINDGGLFHAGWTAEEALKAAVEDAVQGWYEAAGEGEVGPDEGPEAWARGEAAGWPLELDGPLEMQVALLRGSASKQCHAFAEELEVSAEMAPAK